MKPVLEKNIFIIALGDEMKILQMILVGLIGIFIFHYVFLLD